MAEKKAASTAKKKPSAKPKNQKKAQDGRNERGQFTKGHKIGEDIRFRAENAAACKYKEEYPDMLLEFFQSCEGYPTFEAFANSLGVSVRTLENWAKSSQRFSFYYGRAKEIQKTKLIEGGLLSKFNPKFAMFVAINNHDMAEKTQTDTKLDFHVHLGGDVEEESN